MKRSDTVLIVVAVLIAILSPFFIMPLIYPTFQVFLPDGNIVLTPPLRITATLIMSVIDYGMSYIAIYHTSYKKRKLLNVMFYIMNLLWCAAMGALWYLAVI